MQSSPVLEADSPRWQVVQDACLFLIACQCFDLLENLNLKDHLLKVGNSGVESISLRIDMAESAFQIFLDVGKLQWLALTVADLLHSVQELVDVIWFLHFKAEVCVLFFDQPSE